MGNKHTDRNDGLTELTPEQLREQEQQQEPLIDEEILAQLAELECLKAENARLRASDVTNRTQLRRERMKAAQTPTIIGSANGISPTEFDIIVGSSVDMIAGQLHKKLASYFDFAEERGLPLNLALVPVPIWPAAKYAGKNPRLTDRATGEPLDNYEVGRTNIYESLADVPVLMDDPKTGDSKTRRVSLSGVCILNANPLGDPATIDERVHGRERTQQWQDTGLGKLAMESQSYDNGEGTFVGYKESEKFDRQRRQDQSANPLDQTTH